MLKVTMRIGKITLKILSRKLKNVARPPSEVQAELVVFHLPFRLRMSPSTTKDKIIVSTSKTNKYSSQNKG